MRSAIYPGSFDPFTNGHLDIVKRASKLFDKIYICIAGNFNKVSCFTLQERIDMIKEATESLSNVEVIYTEELVISKAKEVGATCIVRGLRAVSDFEFEFQLAAGNAYIDKDIEMIFLMTSEGHEFISSSSVKEFVYHGVDVSHLVPDCVNKALLNKYKK